MEKIKENLYDLYSVYSQYKLLFQYYQDNKDLKSKQDILDRIDYIRKHKVNQRNEVETLLWVLGGIDSVNDKAEDGFRSD